MIALLVVLVAAIAAIYGYFSWHSGYWKRRGIPGPPSTPFYGNWREVFNFNHPMAFRVQSWTKAREEGREEEEFGPVFGFQEGTRNFLVTSQLDMVHEIFVKQFDNFYARRKNPLSPNVDTDSRVHLFESRGGRWKRLRAISSPSFSVTNLKKIRSIVADTTVKMVSMMEEKHEGKGSFDIHSYFMEYTMDVIGRLVIGQKESRLFKNQRVEQAKKIFLRDFNKPLMVLGVVFPSLGTWIRDTAIKFRLPAAAGATEIFEECEAAVTERVKERESLGPPSSPRDFIDLFLDSTTDIDHAQEGQFSNNQQTTKNLTVDEAIMQAIVFLLAGFDTTANALGYTAWMLSRHPEVQRRCQEEIEEVVGEEDEVSFDHLNQMKYLEATCKETLRFYPLGARAVSRTCMKSTVVCGYSIEAGTCVMADSLSIHFDKAIYGEDADEFLPERWLEGRGVPPHAFLPFGGGPRICIGMRLAMMEEKMALTHILRRFNILLDPKVEELTLIGSMSISAREVPVSIERRS